MDAASHATLLIVLRILFAVLLTLFVLMLIYLANRDAGKAG
jgi:hypothetical protein